MEHDETDQLFNALTADLQAQYDTEYTSIRVEHLSEAVAYARDLYYAAIAESGALEIKDPDQMLMLQQTIVKAVTHALTTKYPELGIGKSLYIDPNGEQDGAGSFVAIVESNDSEPHLAIPQKLLHGEAIVGAIDDYGIIPLPTPQDEASQSGGASNQWGFVVLLRDAYIHSGDNRIALDGHIAAIPLQDERLFIGKPVYQDDELVRDESPAQDATYIMRYALEPMYRDIENQLNHEEHDEDPDARRAHVHARREAIEQIEQGLDGIGIVQGTPLRIKALAQGAGKDSTEFYPLDNVNVLFDSPNVMKFEGVGWRVLYEVSLSQVDGTHQPIYVFPEMIESVVRLEDQDQRLNESE